jgi:hypothetical protein
MKTITRPSHFHAFEALDVGFIDRTGWIAGYIDYLEGVIVVEDEFLLPRATTQDIADAIEAHERQLWGEKKLSGGHKQPYKRISDIDHRLVADLRQKHDLTFSTIDKKNIESDVNLVNVRINGKQLLVNEKCVHLRRQLREGVWNRTRKDMARDVSGGHNDLLAALRYGIRVADQMLTMNPYPKDYWVTRSFEKQYFPKEEQPKVALPNGEFAKKLSKWSMSRFRR